jgi:valyl-tRNA synthetase
MTGYFASMANATAIAWGEAVQPPPTHAAVNLPGIEVFVDLRNFIDVGAEIARNKKLREKLVGQIQGKQSKLANAGFVDRAPPDVVQRERESLLQLQQQLTTVEATLANLQATAK